MATDDKTQKGALEMGYQTTLVSHKTFVGSLKATV